MIFSRICKGVTLIELCAVLSIVAIIALSAASYAPSVIHNQRADSAIRELFRLFNFARTEAITSGSIVTVCPVDGTGNCSSDWNKHPVSVFRDPDNSRSITHSETIIKQVANPFTGSLKAAPAQRGYFQFDSLGGARGTPGNLTYSPLSYDTKFTRKIIISFSGRARLAQVKN